MLIGDYGIGGVSGKELWNGFDHRNLFIMDTINGIFQSRRGVRIETEGMEIIITTKKFWRDKITSA